jgi:ribonuclease HI
MITAYFDGSCEPKNPGRLSAYGAVIFYDGNIMWADYGVHSLPGDTTNNQAEYAGYVALLAEFFRRGWCHETIAVYGDSDLVIKQMQGKWKIKNGVYTKLAKRAQQQTRSFSRLSIHWIPREENGVADFLSHMSKK